MSFLKSAWNAVTDVGQGVVNGVLDAGKSLDEVVRDTIPGGWKTVGLVAGGYSLMNAADAAAAEAAGTGTSLGAAAASTDPTISAIQNYLSANPGLTTEQIAQAAAENGISAAQIAQATGVPTSAVESALSGIDLGGVGASPNTWLGAGQYGAVPAAVAGTSLANLGSDALAADNIDVGGGWNPAGGVNGVSYIDPATAAAAAATGVTSSAAIPYGATGGTSLGSLLTPTNVLGASALANTLTGLNTSNAIGNAMATQQAAANQSRTDLGNIAQYVQGVQAPYQAAGVEALNLLGKNKDYLTHQFDATDLAKGLAPNYDFMLQQGQMANQRAANVGGGALSGNTLQGLQKYTQDYAGNAYQNAFTNYQNQRNNIYNTLAGIAGLGQTSTGQLTNAAGTYGTNLTNLNVGNAAAQAAGQVAQAQQTGNTISGLGNTAFLASLLGQKGAVA